MPTLLDMSVLTARMTSTTRRRKMMMPSATALKPPTLKPPDMLP
jgi:hypothetical protein